MAGAIDAAALGPVKKWAVGNGRKKREKSFLCFCCDFSGWCNFGKIMKIVATRCHILELKCTKFDFGWNSAPDPAGGAYSAPRPLAFTALPANYYLLIGIARVGADYSSLRTDTDCTRQAVQIIAISAPQLPPRRYGPVPPSSREPVSALHREFLCQKHFKSVQFSVLPD